MNSFKFPAAKESLFTMPDIPEMAGTKMASFLRGMGVDLSEVTKFISQIAGELKDHNDRAQRVEDKIDLLILSLRDQKERGDTFEQILIATVPEARMIIGDGAAFANNPETLEAYREKGLLDPALHQGEAVSNLPGGSINGPRRNG